MIYKEEKAKQKKMRIIKCTKRTIILYGNRDAMILLGVRETLKIS